MIRSTFAAVPRRLPALVGKALVFAAVTFALSLASLVVTALLVLPVLEGKGISADVGDPKAWLALIGAAGYLTLIGLLSLGIGTIIRNSAGGIAAALGLLLVLPTVLQIVLGALTRTEWVMNLNAFLPSNAGARLYSYPIEAEAPPPGLEPPADAFMPLVLEPWQALIVLLAWVAAAFVAGGILLKRRDA